MVRSRHEQKGRREGQSSARTDFTDSRKWSYWVRALLVSNITNHKHIESFDTIIRYNVGPTVGINVFIITSFTFLSNISLLNTIVKIKYRFLLLLLLFLVQKFWSPTYSSSFLSTKIQSAPQQDIHRKYSIQGNGTTNSTMPSTNSTWIRSREFNFVCCNCFVRIRT